MYTYRVRSVLGYLPWLVFGQGIVLSIVVGSRWRYTSNRYLSIFLFLLGLHGLLAIAWQGAADASTVLVSTALSCIPFLYGPLIYRYVWHSLLRDWPDRVPFVVHSLPAIANLLVYGGVYLAVGRNAYLEVAVSVFEGNAPLFVRAAEWGKIVLGILYTALAIGLILRYRSGLRRWAERETRRRWLFSIVTAFALNWVLVLVGTLLLWNRSFPDELSQWVTGIQLVAFLAFLYMISFFTLRYPAILQPKDVREAIRKKLNLPPGFVEETKRRLASAVEKRFYTDPEVSLATLAHRLGLHPNALSYIINEELESGFREYLNGLRLEEFLRHARTVDREQTLLEVAFEAGFTSKTTFLRAFRTRYGTTPTQYLATQRGTSTHTGAT